MKSFCPLIAAVLLLLIRPLAIHMQYNGYNGYYPGNYPANGYYPYYYGNGYGFCYVNTPYCCYNYIPPNFLYLLGPLISQILRSLSLPNIGSFFNTMQSISPMAPGFFNGLQQSNPPIYNAYNQLYNAYSGMDPAMQQMFRQFCAAMLPAFQNAIGTFNSQPTPQFDQNFPQMANFLRSPGMRQFAQEPFGTQPNGQGASPNQGGQPNQANPQPVAQGQQTPNGGGTGGAGGLVDGILGAVGSVASAASSSLQQGRK